MTTALVAAALALPLGYLAGLAYFRALRASVAALTGGRSLLGAAALRLLAIAALLALAARAGAPALLATAGGFLLGRARVMRQVVAEDA